MVTLNDLTPRQREVALLVAEGLHNKGIGERLGVTDQTVKNHVTAIIGTLATEDLMPAHVNSRVVIARWIWAMQTKGPYPGEPEREAAD